MCMERSRNLRVFYTKSGLCSWKGMCDRREMSSINCELNKFSNILDVVSNWHKSTAASPQRELRAECCVWFLGVCPGWAGPPTHRCLCWLHLDSHQEYHDQWPGLTSLSLWYQASIDITIINPNLGYIRLENLENICFNIKNETVNVGLICKFPSFDFYQWSKWKLKVLSSGSTHSCHHLDKTMRMWRLVPDVMSGVSRTG